MSNNGYEFSQKQKISISLQCITKKSVVMIPQKTEREVFQDDERYKDTGKIERAAVRAVGEYIDDFEKMKPNIFSNDKTEIWDGQIYLYDNEAQVKRNFFAAIPIQVKGTTTKFDDYYRIERDCIEGYKKERGTLFFFVHEDEKRKPIKILYNMLSSDDLNALLEKDTKSIKIELKEVPANPNDFEKEIFEFARKRNGVKIENPATKEIKSLVEEFEEVEKHLNEIDDVGTKLELNLLIKGIKELKYEENDETIGWRDKFIYYSQKAIELTVGNIKDYDFTDLKFELGAYLHNQKLYHLVEDYYVKALEACRERVKDLPLSFYKGDVANTLNNLAVLHDDLNRPVEAEEEYNEALKIRRELAKDNPNAYMDKVANTLNNLANLHYGLNRPKEAEKEYLEALEIRRELAKDNPNAYMGDVAMTLNNLANLHYGLNRPKEAEKEYLEALEIRRRLAKDNPAAYMGDVADTLNNLAVLHKNLNRPVEAEEEYLEALEIYRGLAKDNPAAYIGKVAYTLNGLAYLYASQKEFSKAIDAIDQAIACMPKDAEYYDSKGEILLMKGDEQGALAMWRKVMELDPDFLSRHNGETELHRQLKEKGLIDK